MTKKINIEKTEELKNLFASNEILGQIVTDFLSHGVDTPTFQQCPFGKYNIRKNNGAIRPMIPLYELSNSDLSDRIKIIANADELRFYPIADNPSIYYCFSSRKDENNNLKLDVYWCDKENYQNPKGTYGTVYFGIGTIVSNKEIQNKQNKYQNNLACYKINNNITLKPTTHQGNNRIHKMFDSFYKYLIKQKYEYDFLKSPKFQYNVDQAYENDLTCMIDESQQDAQEELKINESFKHFKSKPYIRQCIDGFYYLTMRNLGDETLYNLLHNNKKQVKLDTKKRWKLAIAVLKAYIEQVPANMVHLDLSAQNIMVEFTEDGNVIVNIIDPSLATEVDSLLFNEVCNIGYKAPELLELVQEQTKWGICYHYKNIKNIPAEKHFDFYALAILISEIFKMPTPHLCALDCYRQYKEYADPDADKYHLGNALLLREVPNYDFLDKVRDLAKDDKSFLINMIEILKNVDSPQILNTVLDHMENHYASWTSSKTDSRKNVAKTQTFFKNYRTFGEIAPEKQERSTCPTFCIIL